MACSVISFHCFLSCALCFQFFNPIFLRSFLTSSSHLDLDLPFGLVAYGFHLYMVLATLSLCILRNAVTACILHKLTTKQHVKRQTSMQKEDAWSGAYPVTVAGIAGIRVFNHVILMSFTLSTIGFCLTWRSQENSPAVSLCELCWHIVSQYSISRCLRCVPRTATHASCCRSLQNFLFFFLSFFVRCNAVSKCVHVDVYPNAGQCHASKYAIVTVHVLQQHSADCLDEQLRYLLVQRDPSYTND